MAFGIAAYIFASIIIDKKSNRWEKRWIFFIIASIVMSIARVAVWVHWPTDIIAWWVVGFIAAIIAKYIPLRVYIFIEKIEKYILSLVWVYKKSS
jgi:membrane-associated phospholipid phosphatase